MWTVIKETPDTNDVSCLLQSHCYLSTKVSGQLSETYGVTSCGSGCWKDVVNQCLEFGQGRLPVKTNAHTPSLAFRHHFSVKDVLNRGLQFEVTRISYFPAVPTGSCSGALQTQKLT